MVGTSPSARISRSRSVACGDFLPCVSSRPDERSRRIESARRSCSKDFWSRGPAVIQARLPIPCWEGCPHCGGRRHSGDLATRGEKQCRRLQLQRERALRILRRPVWMLQLQRSGGRVSELRMCWLVLAHVLLRRSRPMHELQVQGLLQGRLQSDQVQQLCLLRPSQLLQQLSSYARQCWTLPGWDRRDLRKSLHVHHRRGYRSLLEGDAMKSPEGPIGTTTCLQYDIRTSRRLAGIFLAAILGISCGFLFGSDGQVSFAAILLALIAGISSLWSP